MSKNWIQTHPSSRKFFPLQPRQGDLCLADIARHLSMQCRYAGAVSKFYSVAEHSVRVSREVERRLVVEQHYPSNDPWVRTCAQWGLFHDASEAYLQDIVSPVKHQPEFAMYREAERRLQRMITEWAGLPPQEPRIVTEVDHDILGTEARQLKAPLHPEWPLLSPEWPGLTLGWPPEKAEAIFLERYAKLWGPDVV